MVLPVAQYNEEISSFIGGILDKLEARGFLVLLTADPKATATVSLVNVPDEGIYIRTEVKAADKANVDVDVAEEINGYVVNKLYDAFDEIDPELSDRIQDDFVGGDVFVNGQKIY